MGLNMLIRNGAILGACALWAAPAYGTTWYVRTSGNDGNAGTSAASALRTISEAAGRVWAGDTVYVGAGTYAEQVTISRSGTTGALISFIADTSGAQTGDAGDVIVTGSNSRSYAFCGKGSYIRLQGFQATAATVNGIYVEGGAYWVIDKCRAYNNTQAGIALQANGAYHAITACTVYSNGKVGVFMTDQTDPDILNCMVWGNGYGIYATGVHKLDLFNNTLVDNESHGLYMQDFYMYTWNNIVAFNGGAGLYLRAPFSLSPRYNLVWENAQGPIGGTTISVHPTYVIADPAFRNRSGNDYLLTKGSPAVNAGWTYRAPTVDWEGQTRDSSDGKLDIGADEYKTVIRVIGWREVRR